MTDRFLDRLENLTTHATNRSSEEEYGKKSTSEKERILDGQTLGISSMMLVYFLFLLCSVSLHMFRGFCPSGTSLYCHGGYWTLINITCLAFGIYAMGFRLKTISTNNQLLNVKDIDWSLTKSILWLCLLAIDAISLLIHLCFVTALDIASTTDATILKTENEAVLIVFAIILGLMFGLDLFTFYLVFVFRNKLNYIKSLEVKEIIETYEKKPEPAEPEKLEAVKVKLIIPNATHHGLKPNRKVQ